MSTVYHEKMRELQRRFGTEALADRLAQHNRRTRFTDDARAFINSLSFFFLATGDADGNVDCSHKGGAPGYVAVTSATSLSFPTLDGNGMYRSLGNALRSPRVGLLFIRFGAQPRRLRVNGACRLQDGRIDKGHKMIVQVDADQIFPNCPRYIPDLTKAAASPFIPDKTGASAKPGWKSAEDLRNALPENDPHRE